MILLENEKRNKCVQGLEVYNNKGDEKQSSVIESCDYDFAISKYEEKNFRYNFVSKYVEYFKTKYDKEIFNCKFERPNNDSNFINFYIYLWEDDLDIYYRIEDKNNTYKKAFYEILKNNKLLGVNESTHIQFFVKDIVKTIICHSSNSAWHNIHNTIKSVFPEVVALNYFNAFYIFIDDENFESLASDINYLYEIRMYCYSAIKKCDEDNILEYRNFHIRVDNYKNYQSIGDEHYFNSEGILNCLII